MIENHRAVTYTYYTDKYANAVGNLKEIYGAGTYYTSIYYHYQI
jgi:hypothetical protein